MSDDGILLTRLIRKARDLGADPGRLAVIHGSNKGLEWQLTQINKLLADLGHRSNAVSTIEPEHDDTLNFGDRPQYEWPIDERMKHTSVHEAGHAVIGIMLSLPVTGAFIYPHGDGDGYRGRTYLTDEYYRSTQHHEADAVMRYSGRLAERLFFGADNGGGHEDHEWATKVTRRYYEQLAWAPDADGIKAIEHGLQRKAERLVLKYKESIKRVAVDLYKWRRLDADEIVDCIKGEHLWSVDAKGIAEQLRRRGYVKGSLAAVARYVSPDLLSRLKTLKHQHPLWSDESLLDIALADPKLDPLEYPSSRKPERSVKYRKPVACPSYLRLPRRARVFVR